MTNQKGADIFRGCANFRRFFRMRIKKYYIKWDKTSLTYQRYLKENAPNIIPMLFPLCNFFFV